MLPCRANQEPAQAGNDASDDDTPASKGPGAASMAGSRHGSGRATTMRLLVRLTVEQRRGETLVQISQPSKEYAACRLVLAVRF